MISELLFYILFSLTGIPQAGLSCDKLIEGPDVKSKLTDYSFNSIDSSLVVISRYIDALGGIENLLKVKDRVVNIVAEVEGVTGNISIFQKFPDKLLQVTSVNGLERKTIFNGSKGFQLSDLGVKELSGEQLSNLKFDAVFNFILDYPAIGIKVNFDGIENICGKQAFKLRFIMPDSLEMYEYFDVENGLKVRQIKNFNSYGNVIQQISDFTDYRLIDGVKYPFRIEQQFGKIKSVIKVSSIKVNQNLGDEVFEPK